MNMKFVTKTGYTSLIMLHLIVARFACTKDLESYAKSSIATDRASYADRSKGRHQTILPHQAGSCAES
jgi:hypothetical protein